MDLVSPVEVLDLVPLNTATLALLPLAILDTFMAAIFIFMPDIMADIFFMLIFIMAILNEGGDRSRIAQGNVFETI